MNKIVVFILLIVFTNVVIAEKILNVDSRTEITKIFHEQNNFSNKKNRQLLAKALIRNLSELNEIIPRNTPEDEQWMQKEMQESTNNFSRLAHTTKTAIFAKYWLKGRVEEIIGQLRQIATDSLPLKYEAILWLVVSNNLGLNFLSAEDHMLTLVNNNVIPRTFDRSIGSYLYCQETYCSTTGYQMLSSEIVERVAIPMISSL